MSQQVTLCPSSVSASVLQLPTSAILSPLCPRTFVPSPPSLGQWISLPGSPIFLCQNTESLVTVIKLAIDLCFPIPPTVLTPFVYPVVPSTSNHKYSRNSVFCWVFEVTRLCSGCLSLHNVLVWCCTSQQQAGYPSSQDEECECFQGLSDSYHNWLALTRRNPCAGLLFGSKVAGLSGLLYHDTHPLAFPSLKCPLLVEVSVWVV